MSSSEEKTEEASDHRLRNARKEGDVAVSHHLTDGLVFAAVCIAIWLAADLGFRQLDTIFSAAMDAVPNKLHAGEELSSAANAMIIAALYIVAPLLLLAALVSLVVSVTQTRGMFSTEPMKFKFDRLNPSETIKNLFSTRQLGVLIQMVLAVGLIGGIVLSTLNSFIELMIFDIYGTERFIGGSVAKALMYLFFLAAGVYVALGLLDYAQAYFEFLKRNRMSKSDRKREHKENDGDPQLKSELRARWREIDETSPKSGVAGASVVIANPTHFTVALYYATGKTDLPIVVAKGKDQTALKMRAEAIHLSVPIIENPPLARSLYRSVELGGCIGDEHLETVAEIFRWLNRMKKDVIL
jgi:flagellar biosynthesis protein FlhB